MLFSWAIEIDLPDYKKTALSENIDEIKILFANKRKLFSSIGI